MNNARLVANEFVSFLNKAVSPYHAVEECAKLLKAAGFNEIREADKWDLKPSRKYYFTRNKSTIIAFAVGGQFKPGNGVAMIAAHTDSPCLRVKPVSKITSAECLQVGAMTYGGGIWRTWFDRDLSAAGIAIVTVGGKIGQKLVNLEKPIMSIPNLAIHLDSERDGHFTMNKEDHLRPILAVEVAKALSSGEKTAVEPKSENHHRAFIEKLASHLQVEPENILDFDLCLFDTQPAVIGGLNEEFIYGARLDNLVSTFACVKALINSCSLSPNLDADSNIRLIACYDNEECGSESAQGAGSALTEWTLRRLQATADTDNLCSFERSIPRSFLISADQAHAQHPNYKSKHEENHTPRFHKGVVVKINANQRYATTTFTHAMLQTFANRSSVPLQKFIVRNDSPCGSTVGPILSAKLGLKTVDVGTVQLAMHSIREMSCISGVYHAQQLFTEFFKGYQQVAEKFDEIL